MPQPTIWTCWNALLALDGEAFKSAAADKFYEPALEDLPDFEAADSLPFSTGAALADYYREGRATASSHSPRRLPCRTTARRPDRASRCHPSAMTCLATRCRSRKSSKTRLPSLDGRDANNILLYGDKGHRQVLDRQGGCQRVRRTAA